MQPFFAPYSSQVCSADVQLVDEPSPVSKVSSFLSLLYLSVALLSFACRGRIAASPRSWPIIGFLVLLPVGGAVASNISTTSATSTTSFTSTTMAILEDYVSELWHEHFWKMISVFLVGIALIFWALYVYMVEEIPNMNDIDNDDGRRNVVAPQYVAAFAGDPRIEQMRFIDED